MAKRVNTPSPLLLIGFLLCVIGTGILGFLYYDLSETSKFTFRENTKLKADKVTLAEETAALKDKLALEVKTPYKNGEWNREQFEEVLLMFFQDETKDLATNKEKIAFIQSAGITIENIREKVYRQSDELKKIRDSFQSEIKKHMDINEDMKQKHTAKVEELQAKIDEQKSTLESTLAAKNNEITNLTGQKETLNKQLKDSRDQVVLKDSIISEQKQKFKKAESKLDNEIFRLREQLRKKEEISHYKRELEEDGRIINTAAMLRTKTVVINLGKRDRVTNGMKFTVYRMDNGGIQKPKGELIIRRVDENTSLCGIESLDDPTDPLVNGDLIANRVYRRDGKYTFFLIGTFENFSRNELTRLIEKEGSRVTTDLHASTVDYVIVGNFDAKAKDGQNELFNRALRFNLNTMNETEIRRFLRDYSR